VKVTCEPQPDRLEISVLAHVITQGETSGEIEALTGIQIPPFRIQLFLARSDP
jgi:hypothetical protein